MVRGERKAPSHEGVPCKGGGGSKSGKSGPGREGGVSRDQGKEKENPRKEGCGGLVHPVENGDRV